MNNENNKTEEIRPETIQSDDVNIQEDSKDSGQDINEYYNLNILPDDVLELPFDKLDPEIQELVARISNDEILSDEEYKEVKKVVKKYKQYTEKYKPKETIEAYEKLEENITTERELLDILDVNLNRSLHMRLDLGQGMKDIYFKIAPLNDSRAIKFTEQHLDIYKLMNPSERAVYEKNLRKEPMSIEEANVLKSIDDKMMKSRMSDQVDMINDLLASQVTPPEFGGDIDKRKQFWATKFPFKPKLELFARVSKILGLNEEFNKNLFPDSE